MTEEPKGPICVWCNAPWSDDNVRVFDGSYSAGCDTCGFGSEVEVTVEIKCHSCNKVVYKKEVKEHPYG